MAADLKAQLAQLKELHELGLRTDTDFQSQKAAMLAASFGVAPDASYLRASKRSDGHASNGGTVYMGFRLAR